MKTPRLLLGFAAALLTTGAAIAQEQKLCPCPPPEPPPPVWKGSLGGGLSLTGGNTETNSYNLDFALTRDPKTKGVFKADGSYLRTDTDGEATVNRSGLGLRYEHALGGGGRFFGFGEVRYLRDVFKEVDYLITPSLGVGYRFVDREELAWSVDSGLGVAFERLHGQDATTSGALSAGENLRWKWSGSASFVHTARGLWKLDDFGDAYYHFDAGILASLSKRFELKLGFADDYKTKPPAGRKKNDTAILATLVLKI